MSAQFDLAQRTTVVQSLASLSHSGTADGVSADMSGFIGAMVVINTGLVVGTAATIRLEDSDDDSTFAAVAATAQAGDLPATISTVEDNNTYRVAYLGIRRHLRVSLTVVGTTIVMSADIVQFPGRHVNA